MSQTLWRGTWRGRSPDGLLHQPARDTVRPTGAIVRGKFPSRKTGRMVTFEGLLEWRALYLFEASPAVLSYTEQPETARYPDGRRLRRYTPDFELALRDGSSMLIEVKPKANAIRPEIRDKLSAVADSFHMRGRRFHILTDEKICIEPRLTNLQRIYHQARRIPPSAEQGLMAVRNLATAFPISIGDAVARLSPMGLEPYSLLMAGSLICDLSTPLTLDTHLYANLENSDEWFRISDGFGF